jgi:hypothetical protein
MCNIESLNNRSPDGLPTPHVYIKIALSPTDREQRRRGQSDKMVKSFFQANAMQIYEG